MKNISRRRNEELPKEQIEKMVSLGWCQPNAIWVSPFPNRAERRKFKI